MLKHFSNLSLAVITSVLLVACATPATSLDAQWVNPQYAGKKPVRGIMVIGATRDSTNRRLFEDRMVAALSATGIKAMQSYRTLPDGAAASQESVRSAVTAAGVSHAMVTRIGNVSTQVNVSPGMVMGPAWGPGWGPGWDPGGGGFGWGGLNGYYGSMWGPAIPPQITTTQNVHADTRLFDVQDAAVMWSAATTTSLGYDSIPQVIDQFVQLIVTTMSKDGVI